MKCDELKIYLPQDGPWGLYSEETGTVEEETCYLKSDVDEAIAELKARIHELENMPHTDNSDVIELLENQNAELREATRWRKCSEEMPEDEECVLVVIEGKVEKVRYRKFDGYFHNTHFSLLNHSVKYWMPLPKAPEVK